MVVQNRGNRAVDSSYGLMMLIEEDQVYPVMDGMDLAAVNPIIRYQLRIRGKTFKLCRKQLSYNFVKENTVYLVLTKVLISCLFCRRSGNFGSDNGMKCECGQPANQ